MIKLRITVTKEILRKSQNCSPSAGVAISSCAIALAVRDIFPMASVWPSFINPRTDPNNVLSNPITIPLPKECSDFIRTFDDSLPEERVKMNPFSFEIEIPDKVIEQINIDEIKPLLENHPTLELINA